MDDIVGEVVFAEGDEDLLAGDPVAAVGSGHGAGLERADVGAGLRFGEVHRPGPFAGDDFRQPDRLQFGRAVMPERLDRARRQHHHQREAHIGRAQILHQHGGEDQGQALAAMLGGAGQGAPAAVDIGLVGLAEARRHGHALGRPFGADLVADPVQRRELARRELAGALDDRVDQVSVVDEVGDADDMFEQEFLFLRGRRVGHGSPGRWRGGRGGYSAAR